MSSKSFCFYGSSSWAATRAYGTRMHASSNQSAVAVALLHGGSAISPLVRPNHLKIKQNTAPLWHRAFLALATGLEPVTL